MLRIWMVAAFGILFASLAVAQERTEDLETRLRGAAAGQGLLQLEAGIPFSDIYIGDVQIAKIDSDGDAFAYLDEGLHIIRIVANSASPENAHFEIFVQRGQIFRVNWNDVSRGGIDLSLIHI